MKRNTREYERFCGFFSSSYIYIFIQMILMIAHVTATDQCIWFSCYFYRKWIGPWWLLLSQPFMSEHLNSIKMCNWNRRREGKRRKKIKCVKNDNGWMLCCHDYFISWLILPMKNAKKATFLFIQCFAPLVTIDTITQTTYLIFVYFIVFFPLASLAKKKCFNAMDLIYVSTFFSVS